MSPFISLPSVTTLPYTYKAIPSSLPPSSTGPEKPKYIVSSSGHAAHPDDIIQSCQALRDYVQKTAENAEKEITAWQEAIKARDLAEKRRLAPGWLDSDARILEPERKADTQRQTPAEGQANLMDAEVASQGEELDRAFGGMGIK